MTKPLWLALLVVASGVDFNARLKAIIPDDTWTPEAAPAAPPVTLAQHEAALRADKSHTNAFTVQSVVGPPTATRVLFVVPQFHRSPLLPITWSSLGEAIAGVQSNIDFTLTRLVRAHGVRCVGTEGTWLDTMARSTELDQVAGWLWDLERTRGHAASLLPGDDGGGADAEMAKVQTLITPYIQRHAQMLDGAGMALARLQLTAETASLSVLRFGLEDEKLNTRSLTLLHTMRPLEEELSLLQPDGEDDAEDALAAIWRDEWPRFKAEVGTPLQAAMKSLQARRTLLLRDGDDVEAAALGRFTTLAGGVVEEVLRLDSALAYEEYYSTLRTRKAVPRTALKAPSAQQKRRIRELQTRLKPLQAEYERVASTQREHAAVRRTLERLGATAVGRCALVMGANHVDGLVAAARKQGGDGVGILVVSPYPDNP